MSSLRHSLLSRVDLLSTKHHPLSRQSSSTTPPSTSPTSRANGSIGFLEEEWHHVIKNVTPDLPISERVWERLPSEIQANKVAVPQQKNEYDCGLFVLYFIERFIREAPERLRTEDLAMFGRSWFKPEMASELRQRIRKLLLEEFESSRLEGLAESNSSESDVEQESDS